MVGQCEIIKKINTLTLDTFPKTLMLAGGYGSGKHTIMRLIADKLQLTIINISDNLNIDTITEIYTDTEPHIYCIEGNLITEQEESVILKFLEEPPVNAYIIILCENKYSMLNTILNRCQIWELKAYSIDELKQLTTNEDLLNVVLTPGEIIDWESQPISEITNLCNLMIEKIPDSNFANVLTISNKLKFTKDSVGYDVRLVGRILSMCALNKIITTKEAKYYPIYDKINKFNNSYVGVCRDKKKLFEHLLTELKEEFFNEH